MRRFLHHPLIWLLLGSSFGSVAFALAVSDPVQTGWAPLVRLYGQGDASSTVKELSKLTTAYTTALHHTEIDAPTQAFLDGLYEDIEDFDLDSFHDRLPERRGKSHELWVRGDLVGKKYLIRRADGKTPFQVTLGGARNELAAMSSVVRSTPGRSHGGRPTYLLSTRYGVGIGAVAWDRVTEANAEFARLFAQGKLGDEAAPEPSSEVRRRVRTLHPNLLDEDLAILTVLFAAYPQLSETLSRIGQVEDVRTTWPSKGYQQISLRVHGVIDRIGEHYPALAKHLGRLDDLARVDMRWLDAKGRTLLTMKLDSDRLIFHLQCYVKDGKLLPARGQKVFEDEPLEYLGGELERTRTLVDARFKMLGVIVELDDMLLENTYRPSAGYAEMSSSLRAAPKSIHVQGAALGFLPTRLLDAFIPGNIESITRDFFEVAAKGNGARGATLSFKLGTKEVGHNGVFESASEIEALDSFLVKIGLGMVNDRLIPNDRAFRDVKQFATDLHDAFVRDLSRYASRARGG